MAKLTKRYVESIAAPDAESIHWDDELIGFGLRLYPTDRKAYGFQYKLHGRTRRKTLGKHGVITAQEARKNAKLVQADVARGGDPSAKRDCAARRLRNSGSGS
jgi:hypothetical protein